ncbi:hypothetical protein HWV62_16306 [Athelia sp. TMB]|nr:hypothetical protein HWV62_16306 [Athelia sp. TMB]
MSPFAEAEASFGWTPVSSGPARTARNQAWFALSMRKSEYLATLYSAAARCDAVLVDDVGAEWTPEELAEEVAVSRAQTRWFKDQVDRSLFADAKEEARAGGRRRGMARELASLLPKHLKIE